MELTRGEELARPMLSRTLEDRAMLDAVGIVTQDSEALTAVLEAIKMVGVEAEPIPVPAGQLGGCVACRRPVASHFARDGHWLGCLEGKPDTVYILVPAHQTSVASSNGSGTSPRDGAGHEASGQNGTGERKSQRGFRRARYHSALHHKAKAEKLALSDARGRVLAALQENRQTGLLAKQIMKKAGLPHGSLSSTLSWLQAQGLVKVTEDMKTRAK